MYFYDIPYITLTLIFLCRRMQDNIVQLNIHIKYSLKMRVLHFLYIQPVYLPKIFCKREDFFLNDFKAYFFLKSLSSELIFEFLYIY